MSTKKELEKSTKEFFNRHWNDSEAAPTWDFSWEFKGAVPNYLLGGVYALIKNDKVRYIGKGNSIGDGIYQDRGISRRLLAHVIKRDPDDKKSGYILRGKWHDIGIDKIATLGFDKELNYLASALEDFLIGKLNPSENSIKSKKA